MSIESRRANAIEGIERTLGGVEKSLGGIHAEFQRLNSTLERVLEIALERLSAKPKLETESMEPTTGSPELS